MASLSKYGRADLVGAILNRDATACGLTKPSELKIISNRLGWVDVAEQMQAERKRLERFVASVKDDGIRHLLILGMGGSSLAPEMYERIFGHKRFLKSYQIVDTTAPSAINKIDHEIDFTKTLLIVASKSGTTVETISQFRHFYKIVKERRPLKVGRFFAAITDRGSALFNIGRRNRFREMFLNRPDIGGRYSALSFFGIVPSLFTRINTVRFLNEATARHKHMRENSPNCAALQLGVLLGVAAKSGINKIKFYTSPQCRPFVAWLEQLIAESTGKSGVGILPVDDDYEYSAKPRSDWVIVNLTRSGETINRSASSQKRSSTDNPTVNINLPDMNCLSGEILKWEMATTVASAVLRVNPFDEPNVTESKKNSMTILTVNKKKGRRGKKLPEPVLVRGKIDIIMASDTGLDLRRDRGKSQKEVFEIFLNQIAPNDFLAILAFVEQSVGFEKRIARLRTIISNRYDRTVVRGYGPRYLHSTGQLYKGGPQTGHFLILEQNFDLAVEIPRTDFDFGELIRAQAKGEIKALRKRKRPLISINLGSDPVAGMNHLTELI